jgi:hypothetical protein
MTTERKAVRAWGERKTLSLKWAQLVHRLRYVDRFVDHTRFGSGNRGKMSPFYSHNLVGMSEPPFTFIGLEGQCA